MSAPHLTLIGAGNMGGALLRGWLAAGHSTDRLTVIDPEMAKRGESAAYTILADAADAPKTDIVVVAVKPQIIEAVLPGLAALVDGGALLVSVAAGTTLSQLGAPFGDGAALVRVMPNTPSQVGRGMSVCVGNAAVSAEQRALVLTLMEAVGQAEWIDDEALIDAVTGLSGSGPAYLFHMVEAMASAGVAAGLPDDLAMRLARQTVSGAGELLHRAEEDAETLRRNVTSPNGTTAAGLAVLMDELPDLMKRTVAAAKERSKEMAR